MTFLSSLAGTVVGNILTVVLVYAVYWVLPKLLDRLDGGAKEELEDPHLVESARAVHERNER